MSATIFALRNAEPDEWRDIKHTEEAHPQNIHKLTDAQLHAIAAVKVHAVGDPVSVPAEPMLSVRD